MIGRAGIAAGAAVAVSVAVHGALLAGLAADAGDSGPTGGPVQVATIGAGFVDNASGTLSAAPVPDRIASVRATEATEPAAVARPLQPSTSPARTTPVATDTTPLTDPHASVPSSPVAVAPVAAAEAVPSRDAPVAQEPTDGTPRPQARPVRQARPAAAPPSSSGNSGENARAGEPAGQEVATAPLSVPDGSASAGASPREVARYPDLVNQHLGRLRRPSSSFGGTAVIGFSIATGGGLAAIRVVQSSGDAAFDDLALGHIRRAVPFPAPPAGAQTDYAVAIRGR